MDVDQGLLPGPSWTSSINLSTEQTGTLRPKREGIRRPHQIRGGTQGYHAHVLRVTDLWTFREQMSSGTTWSVPPITVHKRGKCTSWTCLPFPALIFVEGGQSLQAAFPALSLWLGLASGVTAGESGQGQEERRFGPASSCGCIFSTASAPSGQEPMRF